MQQPKLTDALIAVQVRIKQKETGGFVPDTVEQAKEMYPHFFDQTNEDILVSAWPDINTPDPNP